MLFKVLAVAAAIGGAVAQRPSNVSICDYYTTALLKNNTALNQKTLLTLVVNTAVIGNCKSGNYCEPSTPAYYFQTPSPMLASLSQVSSQLVPTTALQSTSSHTSTVPCSPQIMVGQLVSLSTSLTMVELSLS